MKQLIYTNAFGPDSGHYDLAVVMFAAIRKLGYTGDCLLIADKAFTFDKALDVDVQVSPITDRLPMYKGLLADDVAKGYTQILYLDTDCLPLSLDGLTALFNCGDAGLAVSQIPWKLCDDSFNTKYFTKDEIAALRARDGKTTTTTLAIRSINTGTFAVAGDKYAAAMAAWRTGWDSSVGPVGVKDYALDQPLLQILIYRKAMGVSFIPDALVGFPACFKRSVAPTNAVLHYVGGGDSKKIIAAMAAVTKAPA
jgi:hypothetical protein